MISSKTGDDAASEFALGEAVFYQNGTWAYNDIKDNEVADEDMGMLPIYIGVDGEENQGLCTGSENYWCVNKNASEEDIQATLDFMKWVVESDEGRDMLANEMGFVTPFTTFSDYLPDNPLVKANAEYTEAGKTPVSWNFTTMPSENWKNNLGGALLNYAQGTGEWDSVHTAFVDGLTIYHIHLCHIRHAAFLRKVRIFRIRVLPEQLPVILVILVEVIHCSLLHRCIL